jgi:hypothetical protein
MVKRFLFLATFLVVSLHAASIGVSIHWEAPLYLSKKHQKLGRCNMHQLFFGEVDPDNIDTDYKSVEDLKVHQHMLGPYWGAKAAGFFVSRSELSDSYKYNPQYNFKYSATDLRAIYTCWKNKGRKACSISFKPDGWGYVGCNLYVATNYNHRTYSLFEELKKKTFIKSSSFENIPGVTMDIWDYYFGRLSDEIVYLALHLITPGRAVNLVACQWLSVNEVVEKQNTYTDIYLDSKIPGDINNVGF